jgi:hypothetical protein
MRILAVFIGFLMLSGCATDEAPVTYQQPSPPPKPPLYRKDGASAEEFQRTKAGCMMKAEIALASPGFGGPMGGPKGIDIRR